MQHIVKGQIIIGGILSLTCCLSFTGEMVLPQIWNEMMVHSVFSLEFNNKIDSCLVYDDQVMDMCRSLLCMTPSLTPGWSNFIRVLSCNSLFVPIFLMNMSQALNSEVSWKSSLKRWGIKINPTYCTFNVLSKTRSSITKPNKSSCSYNWKATRTSLSSWKLNETKQEWN